MEPLAGPEQLGRDASSLQNRSGRAPSNAARSQSFGPSLPNCPAVLPRLSVGLGPVTPGDNYSPERTLRRACPHSVRAGQNICGTCISSELSGYFSHMHFLTILDPPGICFPLRSCIARFRLSSPSPAGDASAESPPILSRSSCLTRERHSEGTLNRYN